MDATPQLDVLKCSGCGAPLALSDAAQATCTSCGAETPIPAAHREAFRQMRRESSTRAQANALYAKLGAPGLGLRIVGAIFDPSGAVGPLKRSSSRLVRAVGWYYGWVLLLFAPFMVLLVTALLITFGMRAIGAHYHANVIETLPVSTRDWIQLPIPLALALIGTVIGVYGRRAAINRHRLQRALAARPPAHAGGPSSCRLCGAPLSVASDALGVRCVYCGADNLVALPLAWITELGTDAAAVDKEITAANAELSKQQRGLRRALWWRAGGLVVVLGTLIAVSIATGSDKPNLSTVPPTYPSFVGNPRPLLQRDIELVHGQRAPKHQINTLAFTGSCPDGARALVIPSSDCDATSCTVRLYAALRAGEYAELTLSPAPPGSHVRIARHSGYPWPEGLDDSFGVRVVDLPLLVDRATTFVADWSAWHELALTLPTPAAASDRSICFAVH